MDEKQYKALSVKEFTKAAKVYDGSHAGIYKMCRDDYPPILEELKKLPFDRLLDVGCYTKKRVREFAETAGLTVVRLEGQKKFRLHLVARKEG